ncbi:MAG: hypothetical protein JWM18_1053 [Chloroflexi bacterium]|jgi:hypothetical protein|nr:hypothetical protein [Chloroflexota bacterium]
MIRPPGTLNGATNCTRGCTAGPCAVAIPECIWIGYAARGVSELDPVLLTSGRFRARGYRVKQGGIVDEYLEAGRLRARRVTDREREMPRKTCGHDQAPTQRGLLCVGAGEFRADRSSWTQSPSSALNQGDSATIERTLRHLQRTAGNASVQRLLVDTESRTERYSLSASIQRLQRYDRDAEESPEWEAGDPVGQGEGEGDLEGDVDLPVITSSYPPDEEADRSIASTLTYSPSVTVSGDEPKTKVEFGDTWGNHIRTKGGKIHPTPTTYEVTETYENPIVIRVFTDAGPHGQTNIASETDSDITKSNFPKVAADLTPSNSDIPPRTQFWARDLTLVHERFHATDGQKFCKDALSAAEKSLNTKSAADLDAVKALMSPIPDQMIKAREAGMKGGEERAYKDGASQYKARADKIKDLGAKGKYP